MRILMALPACADDDWADDDWADDGDAVACSIRCSTTSRATVGPWGMHCGASAGARVLTPMTVSNPPETTR